MRKPNFTVAEFSATTRRDVLRALGASVLFAAPARAGDKRWSPIQGEDGDRIPTFRVPAQLDPATLPGTIWNGNESGDVSFYEFFDYNCGFCRKAGHEVGAMLTRDQNLRFGLVNNPILSPGSVQAAKVQQAVLALFGPSVAYDFHARMFERRGHIDGRSALDTVRAMKLDTEKVEESAAGRAVSDVIQRQAQLASHLNMSMTPSFVIAGVGLLGWPGATAIRSVIENVRGCGRPICNGRG